MRDVAFINTKTIEYYKGIRIKADTGLHEQLCDIIGDILPKGSKILDYGCGEGALSQRLNDLGYDVYSVDINEKDFKAAVQFMRLDFNNRLEVERFKERHKNEYDLVLGVEVIEHVENPWQYLRDLKELTKINRYIIVTTPNITSWFSRVNFLLKGRFHQFEDIDRNYGHINPISCDELELICNGTKLKVERILPGGWLPRIWITSDLRLFIKNIFGFFVSFLMKGIYNGWCIIAIIKRQD